MNDAMKSERRDPLVACTPSGPERTDRRREVEEIFGGCLRANEIEDGHEFVFPGDAEWAARLTEFVVFEPEGGPIRLRA